MRWIQRRKSLLALVAVAALLALLAQRAGGPQRALGNPGASFWVDADPSTAGVQTTVTRYVGETFSVRWKIDKGDTPDYQGYQGKMGVDKTVLQIVAGAPLGTMCSPGQICAPAGPVIQNTGGPQDPGLDQATILGGEVIVAGPPSNFAGDVYMVTLRCLGEGTSPLDLRPPPNDLLGQETLLYTPGGPTYPDTFDAEVVCVLFDADGDGLADVEEGPDAPHAWTVDSGGNGVKGDEPGESGTWISDPLDADTDDDGVDDLDETMLGTNGQDPDSDHDGLCDGNLSVPGVCVAGEDMNANGVVDSGETNPAMADTDGGGVYDGTEVALGLNPLNSADDATAPVDTDGDGCTNQQESGALETLGGLRDYRNPWDFFDVPLPVGEPGTGTKDKQVDGNDTLGVLAKFGATPGDPIPTAPKYDPAYDRSAPSPNPWNTQAPNGVQDGNDVIWALTQFGHSCYALPNAMTLAVYKRVLPPGDAGRFNLRIDGVAYAHNAGNNQWTGYITVAPDVVHTVSETPGVGTDLANYTTAYGGDCDSNGKVTVAMGKAKICIIVNTLKGADPPPPTLKVTKRLVPDTDGGRFNLLIDPAGKPAFFWTADNGNNGTTGTISVAAGAHKVGETAVSGTKLTDYTTVIGGDCDSNGNVTLAPGQNKECIIVNTRKGADPPPPTLKVKKVVVPAGDAGRFNLRIDPDNPAPALFWTNDLRNDGTTGAIPVAAGAHTVSETAGTGTSLDNYNTVIGGDCALNGTVTLAAGENKVCTITNTRK